jgi:two-component system alkaline phosphatase synthesis response regulator PhoP
MKKGKVLVVDDEVNITQILEFSIGAEGFDVITAQNGEEAIEKARREQPDLIILDVMMPKIDGYEACRILKANPLTKNRQEARNGSGRDRLHREAVQP